MHFRERSDTGEWVGGPMYYIKNGLGRRWQFLAVLYALFGVLTVFGTGNATQVNTIVAAVDTALLEYGLVVMAFCPPSTLSWASLWLFWWRWCCWAVSSALAA